MLKRIRIYVWSALILMGMAFPCYAADKSADKIAPSLNCGSGLFRAGQAAIFLAAGR